MLALLFTSILQQISHTLKIEFTQTNINAKIMMTVLDSTSGFSHTVGDLQFSENATSIPPPSYQKRKKKDHTDVKNCCNACLLVPLEPLCLLKV